jgi:hypothetical protein
MRLYWLESKRKNAMPRPKLVREKDLAFIVPFPQQREAVKPLCSNEAQSAKKKGIVVGVLI